MEKFLRMSKFVIMVATMCVFGFFMYTANLALFKPSNEMSIFFTMIISLIFFALILMKMNNYYKKNKVPKKQRAIWYFIVGAIIGIFLPAILVLLF